MKPSSRYEIIIASRAARSSSTSASVWQAEEAWLFGVGQWAPCCASASCSWCSHDACLFHQAVRISNHEAEASLNARSRTQSCYHRYGEGVSLGHCHHHGLIYRHHRRTEIVPPRPLSQRQILYTWKTAHFIVGSQPWQAIDASKSRWSRGRSSRPAMTAENKPSLIRKRAWRESIASILIDATSEALINGRTSAFERELFVNAAHR